MSDLVYHRPASLSEAVRLLSSHSNHSPLAGGTDVLSQMEAGSLPAGLVDVKAIPELNVLTFSDSDGLCIGAAMSLDRVLQFAPVRNHYPMLAQACTFIGSEQIRARATIGGNLCNATPSADTAPPLLCLDARVTVAGLETERKLTLADFFVGPGETALRLGELLVAIQVPPPPNCSFGTYLRHTPRAGMDIAVVGVAALIAFADDERTCREARIALGAVAPTPLRARQAERVLTGQELTDAAIAQVAEAARESAKPIDDVRASAWFRLELVAALTERALRFIRAESETTLARRVA